MRRSARDYHLQNHPIRIREHVLPVDVAPLVAARRTTQLTGLPVIDALAAVPVLVAHMLSFSPVIVPDVLIVLIVVFLVVSRPVVVVLLGEGDSAGEAERQGGYSQSSEDLLHKQPSIPERRWGLSAFVTSVDPGACRFEIPLINAG